MPSSVPLKLESPRNRPKSAGAITVCVVMILTISVWKGIPSLKIGFYLTRCPGCTPPAPRTHPVCRLHHVLLKYLPCPCVMTAPHNSWGQQKPTRSQHLQTCTRGVACGYSPGAPQLPPLLSPPYPEGHRIPLHAHLSASHVSAHIYNTGDRAVPARSYMHSELPSHQARK